jgi:hypothetical protein
MMVQDYLVPQGVAKKIGAQVKSMETGCNECQSRKEGPRCGKFKSGMFTIYG